MNKMEFLSELADIISDNMDCEDVMENIGKNDADVTVLFEDKAFKIMVEEKKA